METKRNNNQELEERLKELKSEEVIWIILIGLIFLSFYNNNIERDFLINKNKASQEKFHYIQIFIFGVATLTYLFYVFDDFKDVFSLNEFSTPKKVQNTYLSLVASLSILLSGLIYIYIAIVDLELETEIAL